ncbi:MAG: protein translocase subunit SecD [Candidatus Wallbacteria bacterium]|nr:protein translocase subunit SecD [Candidatus Wallbacteria bacterium]
MHADIKWKAFLIAIVFAICFVADAPTLGMGWLFPFFGPGYQDLKINLGLDLQGGLDLIYEVVSEKGTPDVGPEVVTRTVEVLQNRLDEFGVANLAISRQGDRGIRIQIPGLSDKMQKRVKELIATTDLLTFNSVIGASGNVMEMEKQPGEIILPHVEPPAGAASDGDRAEWFRLKETPELTGESLSFARIGYDQFGNPKILLEFNSDGRKKFADVTTRMVGQKLAIVLAGKVYTAPVIKEPIRDGSAEITGKFDLEETKRIVGILKAGALPAKLKKLGENIVGPTLGQESIRAGVIACMLGVGLVVLLMAGYYKRAGIYANIGLVFCALIVLALMLFFRATLTLPGIAGLILTLGMAVDANVLIFERIREEVRVGKTVRAAIDAGFEKAFSAIFDSNITTLLTTVILYWFGTGPIKGFAVTLSVGVLASFFTAIVVVRAMMDLTYSGKTVGTISI